MRAFGSYLRRHHLALIALFFALGGASFAAADKLLPRNSVRSPQVVDNSLLKRDFKKGQLPAGPRGPAGLRGVAGTPGALGPQGAQGPKGDPTYVRTIVVGPVGTDIQSGTALQNALAGITDASATKRYLIKIEPGVYQLGSTALALKPYVDVEGSGPITDLRSAVDSEISGAVVGASNSTLRSLSVTATGGDRSNAIYTDSITSFVVDRVSALAQGGRFPMGVNAKSSSLRIESSLLRGDGGSGQAFGLYSFTSQVTVNSSELAATRVGTGISTGAFAHSGSTLVAQWSVFTGTFASVVINGDTAKLAASQLNGPRRINFTATMTCTQSYDGAFADVPTGCAPTP